MMWRIVARCLSALVVVALVAGCQAQAQVTSPEKFFGFQLGADRKIAAWDKIIEYYRLVEKESRKLKVVDMGPSTMGNPFLLVIISAPENLARLDRLREVNARISDPRGVSESEIRKLMDEGKAVICQSMSLHATEIGATQMAPELTHDLLSRTDEETRRILTNVLFFMIPCFNPDGAIMVADWYRKNLGTEYEGGNLPWLYHKYVGHDNNRDAFQTNMIESVYMAKIMFRDWIPQAYVDHHHMGSYGARLYVPPYAEPIRPNADPLIWREHSWYGGHIAYKLEEAGKTGIVNAAQYSGWGHFGFHWITPHHNIAGMLTESASARLATPIYIHPGQLQGGTRGLPEYEPQTTFPHPWSGGWWKLRDIVEQQKISAWALLDIAARNKETVLWNAYQKALRQTERGAAGKPAAFVIPSAQHDSRAAVTLVNKLLVQGIEILQAREEFVSGDIVYPAGSWVISLAQPKMGVIKTLLERTRYPDNTFTRDRDGSPIRPYDMATDTMAEFMGVRVDPVDAAVKADLQKLSSPVEMTGRVGAGGAGYVVDCRLNDAFRAVNLLLDKGVRLRRAGRGSGSTVRAGDFLVGAESEATVRAVAKQTGVDFAALTGPMDQGAHELKRLRIGMYQRYSGGNMDEGWTRFVLEQYGFPFASIMDAEIKKGGLEGKYDVIILPADSTAMITGERTGEAARRIATSYPAEYRSGIGKEGVDALKTFVQKGGTLVTLGEASNFAIEKLELPIRNVVAGKSTKEFFCPGSTLQVRFDNTNPLAYGMPGQGLAVFFSSPAFQIIPTDHNEWYETIVIYPDRDLLQSGWLIGEETLARTAGMIAARYGEGRVVLIGIRAQHRAQTHATYKLLFNALLR
jgi:hypothetical protein